jgi:hypothetical protein
MTPPPPLADDDAIPWERRRELGRLRAFRETFLLSIREPTRFYSLVPAEASIWGALAYALAFDLVVALIELAYHQLVGAADFEASVGPLYPQLRQVLPNAPELLGKVMSASAIGSLLLAPISFLVNLCATTAMTWIGLRLARGLRTSFGRLLRMFAYASWIQLFGLLSVTGDIFLSALSFVLVLGFGSYYWLVVVRGSQGIGARQAMLSSLYGCLVAFAFACLLGIPLLVGVGWLLVSALKSTPLLPP